MHEKAGRCVERGRQGIRQFCLKPHQFEETFEELARTRRVAREVCRYLIHRPTDVFLINSDRVRRRFNKRKRVNGLWTRCCGK